MKPWSLRHWSNLLQSMSDKICRSNCTKIKYKTKLTPIQSFPRLIRALPYETSSRILYIEPREPCPLCFKTYESPSQTNKTRSGSVPLTPVSVSLLDIILCRFSRTPCVDFYSGVVKTSTWTVRDIPVSSGRHKISSVLSILDNVARSCTTRGYLQILSWYNTKCTTQWNAIQSAFLWDRNWCDIYDHKARLRGEVLLAGLHYHVVHYNTMSQR